MIGVGGRDTAKVAYSRAVPATRVKDIARMVVLNRGTYERVNLASEQRSRRGVCPKPCAASVAETKSVVPVAGDLLGEYFVLYGARKPAKDDTPSQSTSAGDDEEGQGVGGAYGDKMVKRTTYTVSAASVP